VPATIFDPVHLFMLFGLFRKRSKIDNFEPNNRFELVPGPDSAGCSYFPCYPKIQNGRAQDDGQIAGEEVVFLSLCDIQCMGKRTVIQ
jgi:hypothetical protein